MAHVKFPADMLVFHMQKALVKPATPMGHVIAQLQETKGQYNQVSQLISIAISRTRHHKEKRKC